MKNLILGTFILVAMFVAIPANAQHYDPRWGVNHNPASPYYGAHHYNNRGYRNPHHYYNRGKKYRTSDLAIAGGIAYMLGRMSVAPINPQPNTQIIYATPPRHRTQVCTIREYYDSYGNLINRQRVCR